MLSLKVIIFVISRRLLWLGLLVCRKQWPQLLMILLSLLMLLSGADVLMVALVVVWMVQLLVRKGSIGRV